MARSSGVLGRVGKRDGQAAAGAVEGVRGLVGEERCGRVDWRFYMRS